jgi:Interferon-induced transmembrane protein/zinc-ribbon domain
MFCPKCGKEIADDAVICVGCGRAMAPGYSAAPQNSTVIPNYMVQSILATLFCCVPFGIVSIVYAAKVNTLVSSGDLSGAREASGKARMWCWISFGVGLAVGLLYIIIMAFAQAV